MHETSRHELAADIPCPTLEAALSRAADAHAARLPGPLGSSGGSSGGGAGAVLALLLDVAEVADATGCGHLSVVLDARMHAGRSLLHPALGRYQGAAGWGVVQVVVGCPGGSLLLMSPFSTTPSSPTPHPKAPPSALPSTGSSSHQRISRPSSASAALLPALLPATTCRAARPAAGRGWRPRLGLPMSARRWRATRAAFSTPLVGGVYPWHLGALLYGYYAALKYL
jgi:hypothetical protein